MLTGEHAARVPSLMLVVLAVAASFGYAAQQEGSAVPGLRLSHTIGCGDCAGPESLSVLDIALREDGGVIVLNEFDPFVRVFDLAGELALTVGREGQGPGELQLPGVLYLDAGGLFRVLDAGGMRFVGYTAAGEPADVVRYPMGSGLVPIDSAFDPRRGGITIVGFRPAPVSIPTVATLPLDGSAVTVHLSGRELPGIQPGDLPRPTEFAVAVGPNGELAIGNGVRYRIGVYDIEGNLLWEHGRDLPRPAKSGEELEEERRRSRRAPDPYKPHFSAKALQLDDRGRLWVLTEHGGATETAFDLFDLEAGYLGTLTLPTELYRRIPAFEVRNGRLAAVAFDETGNTIVTVWELIER
ncbi:MAG TPA: hypothetical protein VGD06_08480 [Acidobacteriota bacterium]